MTTPTTTHDAANRTWRTVLQGAVVVGTIAAATALLEWLEAGDFSWRTLGVSAGTAALMAVLAFLHRTVLDPSGLPSALPPANPGPPAEPSPDRILGKASTGHDWLTAEERAERDGGR